MTILLSTAAIVLYLILGVLLGKRLFSGSLPLNQSSIGRQRSPKWLLPLGSIAIVTHAIVLHELIFIESGMGLNLGFYNAASLITWLIVLLLLIASITKPIENLGIIIFPLASITLLLENLIPSSHIILTNAASELRFHILISVLAYSLFSVSLPCKPFFLPSRTGSYERNTRVVLYAHCLHWKPWSRCFFK
jgi:ABC-type uncharacterized transport system permease subunit